MVNKFELTLQYYQQVNLALDQHLVELSQLEFNFDVVEMQLFVNELQATNSEYCGLFC